MKELLIIIAVLLIFLFSASRMVLKLDGLLTKTRAESVKWEQAYRDCQAARQFSEPAQETDAVQPTVQP